MIHADLKSKLRLKWDEFLEKSEDYLTASFFGIMNYLPTTTILDALLPHITHPNEASFNHTFHFWPRYTFEFFWQNETSQKTTEPDLVIQTKTAIVIIEAKYTADLGSDETQLPRQLILACQLAKKYGVRTYNIAVTADNIAPLPRLRNSILDWLNQIPSKSLQNINTTRRDIREQLSDRLSGSITRFLRGVFFHDFV